MDERIVKFRVGVMVLASFIIFGILVALFGNVQALLKPKMSVRVRFVDAPGVLVGTTVRKSGIPIGKVTDVDFNDDGSVIVTCQVESDVPLSKDDAVRVGGNLLGEATVNFVSKPAEIPPEKRLQAGDELKGSAANDPMQMIRNLEQPLGEMIASVTTTSNELGELGNKVNTLLGDNEESISRALAKTEETLDAIKSAAQNVDELLKDPVLRADLKRSLAELPQVLQESREAFAGMQNTLTLANRNLENMESFTKPLGARTDATFDQFDRTAVKFETLIDELTVFSRQINNRQGTLGKLVNDPELYDNLNSVAANIDQLTREIKPVLYDVRVFTDKIARDPGSIGVRGVFQQKTGIK